MTAIYGFKNFKDLTAEESREVLDGRNDPLVRSWMTSDREITAQEHQGFLDRLANDARCLYLRIERNGRFVGVYSLNDIEDREGLGGFWVTTEAREKMLALNIVFQGMNHMFRSHGLQRIHGRQRTDNHGAIRLNSLLGLTPCGSNPDGHAGYQHIETTHQRWAQETCRDVRLLRLMDRSEQLNSAR